MPDVKHEIRISPDGEWVSIRTIFEDAEIGTPAAWLAVSYRGIAANMSEAQVADWKVAK